jgi:hypothetical protein
MLFFLRFLKLLLTLSDHFAILFKNYTVESCDFCQFLSSFTITLSICFGVYSDGKKLSIFLYFRSFVDTLRKNFLNRFSVYFCSCDNFLILIACDKVGFVSYSNFGRSGYFADIFCYLLKRFTKYKLCKCQLELLYKTDWQYDIVI